jgi:membrane associated rhomboid family serine protease
MNTTLILIIITIGISIYAWKQPALYQKWILNPYKVSHLNQYWRFLTSGFLHLNYTHLFFNMFALYFFGQNVAYYFGRNGDWMMIALFLLGIIVSDIPTYLKHRNNPNYNSLGASGGVAAVIFSSIMFDPLNKIYLFFIPIGIPGFILGVLYIIYSYYQSKNMTDNINHDAHLFGSIFGIVFTVVVQPQVVPHFFEQIKQWSL